jgi:hypothetical protein
MRVLLHFSAVTVASRTLMIGRWATDPSVVSAPLKSIPEGVVGVASEAVSTSTEGGEKGRGYERRP